ncbi:hypothetical protein ECTPHS_02596 [Ectothiorhodospira sp. PHS-1]|uniref:protease complex subunit PrcB family protein n=1 Tax=Ectothiorhodospira sp. PHS-1 TaxID=519989 RepID=UPI00024A8250|nr:protease complex subunit PrcB family protein [Ectothiorhodospira sp. PHS-1]EHQ51551.1 hypothetical protein ECTPHS_02596 [Ectothiorhodospira sp. PHS-1]
MAIEKKTCLMILLTLPFWITATGCRAPCIQGSMEVAAVRVLAAGTHCGHDDPAPRVRMADTLADLERLLADTGLGLAGSQPDPARERFILIHQGLRPTLGYRLELAGDHARLEGETWVIRVIHHEPPPDAVTAQALSSPCLLLGMERTQDRPVRVEDQDGNPMHGPSK